MACAILALRRGKPRVALCSPFPNPWCKPSDYASNNKSELILLNRRREAQTSILNNVALMIKVVVSFDTSILIDNPAHSMLWEQPVIVGMRSDISTVNNPARSFRLNIDSDDSHWKQFKFLTNLPPTLTEHLESSTINFFVHPQCVGKDANGVSVPAAPSVRELSLPFMLVAMIGCLNNIKDSVSRVSDFVLKHPQSKRIFSMQLRVGFYQFCAFFYTC